ncbi:MAG TPA: hypothetical protein PLY23_02960 [Alphaproteobacteria bacterium]|nr:hypothetical protein [Alphaproteobacteria bacterium]HQS93739.1 hypothetical protein [Alphaproteobacteria bacterium]
MNPHLPEIASDSFDASPKNMLLLVDIANTYIIEHAKEIDDIIEILESNH